MSKQEVHIYSNIENKVMRGEHIHLSGYASTSSPDLVNDIIEPKAFEKHLAYYKKNPIYCFNHDRAIPIGRVNSMHLTDKGLYLEDIVLSNIPLVKDVLGPLVMDGVLQQQSIGFLSLAGKPEGKFYKHTEVFLLEASLVSVACNPTAEIDSVASKVFKMFPTLDEFIQAYERDEVTIDKKFYIPYNYGEDFEGKNEMKTTETFTPDFRDIEALNPSQTKFAKYDRNGDKAPNEEFMECVYAAKSNKSDSYLFPMGVTTNKGYKYEWENVAASIANVLGAKGGFVMDGESKKLILDRFAIAYAWLSKEAPTYNDKSVFDLTSDELSAVSYKDIIFNNDEKVLVTEILLKKDLLNVKNALEFLTKEKLPLSEDMLVTMKSMYGGFSYYMSCNPSDEKEVAFLNSLINLLYAYNTQPESEDDGDMHPVLSSLEESGISKEEMVKFAEFILTHIKSNEEVEEEKTQEIDEITKELMAQFKQFADFENDFVQ